MPEHVAPNEPALISWPRPQPGDLSFQGQAEHKPASEFCFRSNRTVHVWAASLDVAQAELPDFKKLLSTSERDRAARFRFDLHRNRFIVAHGWLRRLLSKYIAIPPGVIEFDYGKNGKPFLPGRTGTHRLEFNLAHSEGMALIAVANSAQVGVDVERVRNLPDAQILVSRFFSRREAQQFKKLPEDQQPAAFFNLWTRKEAWLKCTGEGIANLLAQVEVSFVPGDRARLLSLPEELGAASCWSLRDLSPGPGFAAAVALAEDSAQPQCWHWDHPSMNTSDEAVSPKADVIVLSAIKATRSDSLNC